MTSAHIHASFTTQQTQYKSFPYANSYNACQIYSIPLVSCCTGLPVYSVSVLVAPIITSNKNISKKLTAI